MHTLSYIPKATKPIRLIKAKKDSGVHFKQLQGVRLIHSLQRTIGNQAVQRFFMKNGGDVKGDSTTIKIAHLSNDLSRIPSKADAITINLYQDLNVNSHGDIYEQEADRNAEKAISMPKRTTHIDSHSIWSDLTHTNRRYDQSLTELTASTGSSLLKASPMQGLSAGKRWSGQTTSKEVARMIQNPLPGKPLAPGIKARIEPIVGARLDHVRVHDDHTSAQLADRLEARAFTHRNHIWLGRGEREHDTRLMAHEAAHVIQQQRTPGVPRVQRYSRSSVFNPGDMHWRLIATNRKWPILSYSAGSIIRGTQYSDYSGWRHFNGCRSFIMRDSRSGAEVEIRSGVQVNGVHQTRSVGTYIKDAWVEANINNYGLGTIDATVGWSRPFREVRSNWDSLFDCAALHLPIEVRISMARGTMVMQNNITYYGSGALCIIGTWDRTWRPRRRP